MKLLTKEILKKIPPIYAQDSLPEEEKVIHVKFFTPWAGWTWYGLEYDPEEQIFFGYVEGLEKEYGYFSLKELEQIQGPFGLKVERDRNFSGTIADIK